MSSCEVRGGRNGAGNLRYYPYICLERLRKFTNETLVRVFGMSEEIRTGHFPNTRQNLLRCTELGPVEIGKVYLNMECPSEVPVFCQNL